MWAFSPTLYIGDVKKFSIACGNVNHNGNIQHINKCSDAIASALKSKMRRSFDISVMICLGQRALLVTHFFATKTES